MDIQITSRHFKARQDLLSFTEAAVKKLSTHYDGIVNAKVILEHEAHHMDSKMAEIVLMVYHDQLVAKEKSNDFEKSVAACIHKLEKQIHKYKEKLHKGKYGHVSKDVLLPSDEEF